MNNDPMRTWLTRLSLAAGVAFTASAEYQLAITLGAGPIVAAMLPIAIDAYVIAALRWFRHFDIALSLSLMGAAQVAAHLLDTGVVRVDILLVTVVSLLVPISIWRTHALARVKPVQGGPTTLVAPQAEPPAVLVERADQPPTIKVPALVPDPFADKEFKALLPAVPEPPAEPEPELTAVGFLARRHKVRPDQIRAAVDLLTEQPAMSGKALGEALETTDRYGRRVLAAAKEFAGVRS
jgi:hypothetical protein